MSTLTQLRAAISGKLGLDNTVAGDQTFIDAWINEGYTEIIARTKVNVQVATMALTAGSTDYTLPTQILALNDLYITDASNSVLSRMIRVSSEEILNMRIGTQNQGAPPVRWYALNGANLLMVYPAPAAADTLTAYYIPRPTALTAGSDTPSAIPTEWHTTIEYFGLWQGGQYINDGASQNGATYQQLYEAALAKMRKAALHRGGRKLSPAVVGRQNQRSPIGQPSQQGV